MKNTKLFSPIVLTLTALSGLARSVLIQNAIRVSERLGFASNCGDSQNPYVLKHAAALVFFPSRLQWVPVTEKSLPQLETAFKPLEKDAPVQRFDAPQYDAFVTALREAVTIEETVGDMKLTLTPHGITIEQVKPANPSNN